MRPADNSSGGLDKHLLLIEGDALSVEALDDRRDTLLTPANHLIEGGKERRMARVDAVAQEVHGLAGDAGA